MQNKENVKYVLMFHNSKQTKEKIGSGWAYAFSGSKYLHLWLCSDTMTREGSGLLLMNGQDIIHTNLKTGSVKK